MTPEIFLSPNDQPESHFSAGKNWRFHIAMTAKDSSIEIKLEVTRALLSYKKQVDGKLQVDKPLEAEKMSRKGVPGDGNMRLDSHWQSQSRELKFITNPKIERLQKSARKVRTQIYHREQEDELLGHARITPQNHRGARKVQLDFLLLTRK